MAIASKPLSQRKEAAARFALKQGRLLRWRGFLGSAQRSQGVAESLAARHVLLPTDRTKWAVAAQRSSEGFQFPLALGRVNVFHPIGRQGHRPGAEELAGPVVAVEPPPETGPAPLLGALYQVGAQRIAFDVAGYGVKVVVAFDGEGFEATLVDMTCAGGMVMCVLAHAVRVRQPPAEVTHVVIPLRPKQEMPVIGHQHEGQDPYWVFGNRFGEHALERRVIGGLFKQRQACHGPVKDMVNETTRCMSRTSSHSSNDIAGHWASQGKTSCVLFSF